MVHATLIVESLQAGKVIIYPTDTVYGIGCDATNKQAVSRVYSIKKRDPSKPVSVIMGSIRMIKEYCEVTQEQQKLIEKYLPGPFTFILKQKKPLACDTPGTLAVRIPDYAPIVKACEILGKPIVTTSANISGSKESWSVNAIDVEVVTKVDFVFDGGPCKYRGPSTVYDCTTNKIARQGVGVLETDKQ